MRSKRDPNGIDWDTTELSGVYAVTQYQRNIGFRVLASMPTGEAVDYQEHLDILFGKQWIGGAGEAETTSNGNRIT